LGLLLKRWIKSDEKNIDDIPTVGLAHICSGNFRNGCPKRR
jgi:hypothetical protein